MSIALNTQPGVSGRPNEDWVAATSDSLIVLDGVTAPRIIEPGCRHSVTWFTRNFGSHLLVLLNGGAPLRDALADAIRQTNDLHRTCDLASEGTPAAALAILRRRDEVLEYLVLADTTVVLDTASELLVITDHRVEQAAPEAIARTRNVPIGTPEHEEAVAQMSVEQLKQRNVVGGYWVAATDPDAASHAIFGEVPAHSVRRAAVFSDGASRVVDVFQAMDWPTCLDHLQQYGPSALIRYIRKLEEDDPDGRRWSRFKKSDDATVALLEELQSDTPRVMGPSTGVTAGDRGMLWR